MKFLVDAQLPLTLTVWLRTKGHDADHVSEVGLLRATDREIRDVAVGSGAILVTKDRDFVPWAIVDGANLRLLWIRLGNVGNASLTGRLEAVWDLVVEDLAAGGRVVEVGRP